MRIRKLLLCEDESWDRLNLPPIIESCWQDMFGEQMKVHGCSDIVDDERPPEPCLSLNSVGQYDALLLDVWWGTPSDGVAHGVKIAEIVRHRYPELPILVLSRHVRVENFPPLISQGIAAYLTKADPTAQTWCVEIQRAIDGTGRERAGQPLYQLLRRLLADCPDAWFGSEVGEAASEVWRHESPYRKWEKFWEAWGKCLGDRRINIPCDELAKFFAKEELLTLAVGESLRGHLEHVLHVYFTGYVISHRVPEFRQYALDAIRSLLHNDYRDNEKDLHWDSFQVSWLTAATLHDAAYPLEILPDVAREASRIQGIFPFAQITPQIPPLVPQGFAWNGEEGRAGGEALDTVFRRLYDDEKLASFVKDNTIYPLAGPSRRFNHGVASGAYFMDKAQSWAKLPKAIALPFLQWTATAMSLHALKHAAKPNGVNLSLKRDPLAFLLALCDELQVWNRTRPDETPASSDFRRVELVALEISGNKVAATIEYDFFPLIDPERRKKAVATVRSRLNKDQQLLQDYLKPTPLGIEIRSRIREPHEDLPPITLE